MRWQMPSIVRWPGKIPVGQRCETTITHTDILATLAEVAETEFPDTKCEDSFSFLKYATQPTAKSTRPPVIHHTSAGMFAIRDGKWKLVSYFNKPWELYDLDVDRSERNDLAANHPEIVSRLDAAYENWAHRSEVIDWEVAEEFSVYNRN